VVTRDKKDCSYPNFTVGFCDLENIIYKGQREWLNFYYAEDSIGYQMSHWDDKTHKTVFHTTPISLLDVKFVINNLSFTEEGIGIYCVLEQNGKDVYFGGQSGAYFITNEECDIIAIGKDNRFTYKMTQRNEKFMIRNKQIFEEKIEETNR
jgi:hypothetical protein